MSFDVPAEAYDHFMGRYSRLLAPMFADFAGVRPGGSALDVGCGPGALTGELISRLGAEWVTAVDPSNRFVAAVRDRFPGVVVHMSGVERLPFATPEFETTLAQLVVHHLEAPIAGVGEMSRVTRPGGTVAACVWDHVGGVSPLGPFWRAVAEFDPAHEGEAGLPGSREGHLVEIFQSAGLGDVEGGALEYEIGLAGFDDWWDPFPLGVGPAGAYLASLGEEKKVRLRELCREQLPSGPFELPLRAWAARGMAIG